MILDQYMKLTGITETALAERVGVSQPHIGRIRKGERRPSPELAKRLEAVTNIPADKFIFGEGAAQ